MALQETPVQQSSAKPDIVDVVIVGAGPTGLMAAALLRRCGVSVRILDKSPTAAKESRAFGIQARSMELFLKLGLAETLLDRGLLATGAQVYVDGTRTAELNFDDIGRSDAPYQFLLMVPQSEIEAVLVDDLASLGVTVERGVEVTGLEQADGEVRLEAVASGQPLELRGRYVIGADGAHSMVRKALGLSFAGGAYAQTFLLADCRLDWPLGYGRITVFVHGRSFGLYLPLKGKAVARIMAVDPHPPSDDGSIASQGSSAVSLEEVEAAFRAATGVEVRLSDPVWTTRYRVHHRGADRYRVGRAFVAGDAAHIHSPAGGQGMNTGLQDAANLAWKLALALQREDGAAALLDSYDAERRPVGERVLAYTDRLFSFMTAQEGWAANLRKLALPALTATVSRLGLARNRAFHFISQLGIHYPQSALVRDSVSSSASRRFREAPAAGHRAPNAAIERGRDVFDLIAGYAFDLLALSRTPLEEGEIARLAEGFAALAQGSNLELRTHLVAHSLIGRDPRLIRAESGQVFDAYGLDETTPQALYLIRPDGYIAWRTDSLDLQACRAFLQRAFG